MNANENKVGKIKQVLCYKLRCVFMYYDSTAHLLLSLFLIRLTIYSELNRVLCSFTELHEEPSRRHRKISNIIHTYVRHFYTPDRFPPIYYPSQCHRNKTY